MSLTDHPVIYLQSNRTIRSISSSLLNRSSYIIYTFKIFLLILQKPFEDTHVQSKSYGGQLLALASAVLWNSLPQLLRDLQSVETFQWKLTEQLFLRVYMEH